LKKYSVKNRVIKERRVVGGQDGWFMPENSGKLATNQDPKKAFSGALGRGVLRFSRQAYRILVHILAIFAKIHENPSF